MQTKLTLRMDEALIERAKAWAHAQGVSLSAAVAQFFRGLPDPETQGPRKAELHPWVRSLTGVAARPGEPPPSDEEIEQDVAAYLKEKYG